MKEHSSPLRLETILLIIGALLFWSLRIVYWSTTSETLFSDMLDFETTARGVLSNFCFDFNPFFKSYLAPSIPALRALQIYILGDSMVGWQIFQTTILFFGVAWLAHEIATVTRIRILGVVLVWVVALSKPSIFWGLKLAREGIGESFAFLALATLFWAVRKPSVWSHSVAGIVFCIGMLIRGTFIFALPFVLVTLYVANRRNTGYPVYLKMPIVFLLGLGLVWGPWIARSIHLYGAPVLLSTMGPYVFFWDLGKTTIALEDGSSIEVTAQGLQEEAPGRFSNDFVASQYVNHLVRLYVAQNLDKLPSLLINRITRTVTDPSVHLTTVSRENLYQSAGANRLLLDKSPPIIILGTVGLLLAPILIAPELILLPLLSIVPWINAAIMIGYARMLESFISIILFGNILLLACIVRGLAILSRGATNAK